MGETPRQLEMLPSPAPSDSAERRTRVGRMRQGLVLRPDQVYAGRPRQGVDPRTLRPGEWGWLGNPFDVRTYGTAGAIGMFLSYFGRRTRDDAAYATALRELRGRELLCWCLAGWDSSMPLPHGYRCHCQPIARWIDADAGLVVPEDP